MPEQKYPKELDYQSDSEIAGRLQKVVENSDGERQQKVFAQQAAQASWERIGTVAEKINQTVKALGTDYNLSVEELIKAMYLDLINWREFYPRDQGGPERFDILCRETIQWFESQLGK